MKGAIPPTADLYTETAAIRQNVSDLINTGHYLIVLMHSYGGQENQSIIRANKQDGHDEFIPVLFNYAEDNTCVPTEPKRLVGPELSDENLEAYLAGLGRLSGKVYGPLEHCAWRDIPVSYVQTPDDGQMPFDYQKGFAEVMEATGCNARTFAIETGHCSNITAPEEFAKTIEQVVAGAVA